MSNRITTEVAERRGLFRLPIPEKPQTGTHTASMDGYALSQAVGTFGHPVFVTKYRRPRNNRGNHTYWSTIQGAAVAEALVLAAQITARTYEALARDFGQWPGSVFEFNAAAKLGADADSLTAIIHRAATGGRR